MNLQQTLKHTVVLVACGMALLGSAPASADPLDLATLPLANSPTVTIQPNLLFILDDSGSMAWDFMPDYVRSGSSTTCNTGDLLCRDASYNTIAYNPAIRYDPPVDFDAGGLNTTKFPSQTGASTAAGASTASKPNWRAVKSNPFSSSSTKNIEGDTYFYHILPGEYCTRRDLKVCVAQSAPSSTYPYPAPVRFCNNSTNANSAAPPANSCQATRLSGFTNRRMPIQRTSTLTISSASSNPVISGLVVNGQQIMSGSTTGSGTTNQTTLASRIVTRINDCTYGVTGNCTIGGYSASNSGSTITITGPTAFSGQPSAPTTSSGSVTTTRSNFTKSGTGSNVPGEKLLTVISDGVNSYPMPGSASKAPTRTDCVGSTCTFMEEMTNYANWYAYYRTRTQMMKTAVSLAFKDIGEDFRIGFMATSTRATYMLDFKTFDTSHKAAWYSKLFAAPADRNTPLRGALSKAGRIYAHVPGDTAATRGVFNDPIEYECQQNYTLLTTDGFWNTNDETSTYAGGPLGLDKKNVGNMDSAASGTVRPMLEGTPARADTLADVAKYYRDTDLRDTKWDNCINAKGQNVCQSPAPSTANKKQTMVTMTLGLGVDGTLAYTSDYQTASSGDFMDIRNGAKNWPDPISNTEAERIDDLWHAAVNGGGTYFSAKNPSELVNQLQEALASIEVKLGAGAAAATSTLNPVTGDNFAYVASYTTGHWTGNLEKREIDTVTGGVGSTTKPGNCVEDVVIAASCSSPSSVVADGVGGYSCVTPDVADVDSCTGGTFDGLAQTCSVPVTASCTGKMRSLVSDTSDARTIYMSSGSNLVPFSVANVTSKPAFQPSFLQSHLSQWPLLSTEQRAKVTTANLVAYLRGQTGYEESASDIENRVFRKRQAVLGDVVNARPAFVGKSTFNYSDSGYDTFKAGTASRAGIVYVAANDGMLHAFDANTLEEKWAFVPTPVIPNMWKLADFAYDSKHSYYVDGTPVISDVYVSGTWKTILVAGLSGGGRGYYALDVTNPTSPTLLWEFDADTEPNLGYTYGNPVITKRASDGKWVVLVTSGYNNISPGNGKGYLYVLDAANGSKLTQIDTGVGDFSTPSGLAKITGYAEEAEVNNLTTYVYGGDLLGNLWRFDLSDNSRIKLAELKFGATPQPITTEPEIGLIKKKRVIFVGTGKYLEISDLTNTDQQTLYAIKDEGTPVDINVDLVPQTMAVVGGDKRESTSNNAVNWVTSYGWRIDFPDTGERQHVAPSLVLGTLLVPTTVPTSSACQPAGYGWLSFFDYRTGLAVKNDGIVSQMFSSPVVGFNVVYIDGKPKVNVVKADDPNPELVPGIPFTGSGSGFTKTRSIWRELVP